MCNNACDICTVGTFQARLRAPPAARQALTTRDSVARSPAQDQWSTRIFAPACQPCGSYVVGSTTLHVRRARPPARPPAPRAHLTVHARAAAECVRQRERVHVPAWHLCARIAAAGLLHGLPSQHVRARSASPPARRAVAQPTPRAVQATRTTTTRRGGAARAPPTRMRRPTRPPASATPQARAALPPACPARAASLRR